MAQDRIPQPITATGRPLRKDREPLRLYLVEDNDDLVAMLSSECASIENVVVVGWSACADDAIERIASSKPDVVLIDIHLRSGSGIDVIRAIRRAGAAPAPSLLAMSNTLNAEVRTASLSAGADDYFDKTLDYAKLLTRVSDLAG